MSDIAKDLTLQGRIVPPAVRTTKGGRTINTAKIGRTRAVALPPLPLPPECSAHDEPECDEEIEATTEAEAEAEGYRSLLGGEEGEALQGKPRPQAKSPSFARLETLQAQARHLGESGDPAWRRRVAAALRLVADELQPLQGTEAKPVSNTPLWRALHHRAEAAQRWDKLWRTGATDSQLKEAVAKEFGILGNSTGPGMIREEHKGGTAPRVVLGEGRTRTVELSGAALLGAVRATLLIAKLKEGGQ